jgi:hypothetical protein
MVDEQMILHLASEYSVWPIVSRSSARRITRADNPKKDSILIAFFISLSGLSPVSSNASAFIEHQLLFRANTTPATKALTVAFEQQRVSA